MKSITTIDADLVEAMKAHNQMVVETLRGLKTRLQNERIAKGSELLPEDTEKLVSSEVKRRREAATMYTEASRPELAEKELSEAAILAEYLPPQVSTDEITIQIEKLVKDNGYTQKDFGLVMQALKATFGSSADGAILAQILKEKLK